MDKKIEKLQSTILRDISIILQREIKNDREALEKITVVEAKLTKDMSNVKIYYTAMLDDKFTKEYFDSILESNLKEIRMILAHKINIKNAPTVSFVYDNASENASRIEEILDKINKENK